MDLSKALDTINHPLLLATLHAYGFSKQALAIICSCLSNRKQRIKINNVFSSWKDLILGVYQRSVLGRGRTRTAGTSKMEHVVIIVNGFQPLTIIKKGSILDVTAVLDPPLLGPLLFKIYVNGLLFFLKDTAICNFADDTTTKIFDESLKNIVNHLRKTL